MKFLSKEELQNLEKKSSDLRGAIITMTSLAASGHPGGSMSSLDMMLVAYSMADCPADVHEKGDYVVVSNGHVSPAVYSCLSEKGFFNLDDAVSQFRLAGSIFEGHIEPDVPGVLLASGNLGQGLSAAVGFGIGSRLQKQDNQIFVFMGDGEQQKGQIGEARRFAAKYDLKNITVFVDFNELQIGGDIKKVMPQNIKANYEADGWYVIEIDGHNYNEIHEAIKTAVDIEKPVMVLAHTVMGKGVSFMENKEKYHGSTLSREQLIDALKELGAEDNWDKYMEMRNAFVPEQHKKTEHPVIKFTASEPQIYDAKTDNRSAWGNAINNIAKVNCENTKYVVFDCDLAGSVKVDSFAKTCPENFFEAGITEHSTATMAGSLSKMGFHVYFADFGVFGVDETFNQHRLNDINNTNLKIITTHVGLDVGEDGKTHQCVDYLGLMRNLYGFKTIVPADPNQTDHIIRYISSVYGNFLVPMGRSKLPVVKNAEGNTAFDERYKFEYGKADLLMDGKDAAMFVMGTVTGRAVEACTKLAEEGISVQLWNIACPEDIDVEALKKASETGMIFTYEDHNVNTGLGAITAVELMKNRLYPELHCFGVEGYALSGKSDDVFRYCRLDAESVYTRMKDLIKK